MRFLFILLILFTAVQVQADDYCILIIEDIGDYPTPIDPENPTAPEQALIDAWQARFDNYWGIYGKIDKAEDWLLTGSYTDIIQPGQGPVVTKAGQFGILHHFPAARILKDNPGTWFANRIQVMRDNGRQLRGWVISIAEPENVYTETRAFLEGLNYVFQEPAE